MIAVSFSLTEKICIDPVLHLRAPLPPIEEGESIGWPATVWHVFHSEITARVVALSASLLAGIDVGIHVSTGIYKGTSLLLRSICYVAPSKYLKWEPYTHFKRACFFSTLTIIGSIAGVIWPGIFKYYRYAPPPPPDSSPDSDPFRGSSPYLCELAKDVEEGREITPFPRLKSYWEQSSLEEKHWFVSLFSSDKRNFETVREKFRERVYKLPMRRSNAQVQWFSLGELSRRISSVVDQSVFKESFYYHATSETALRSILSTRRVEVRHEKAFCGAFVSTKPERIFGPCILAFRRNIERLSSLNHGFRAGQDDYWAGFSRDIPVTKATVAFIILDGGHYQECQALRQRCQQWAGRSIQIVSLDSIRSRLSSIKELNMGIPSEWPADDPAAQTILHTLQARANQQEIMIRQSESARSLFSGGDTHRVRLLEQPFVRATA